MPGAPSGDDAADELEAAWREIADGCERGLALLHPLHPHRAELLAMTRDARLGAGLPADLPVRIAGDQGQPLTAIADGGSDSDANLAPFHADCHVDEHRAR